MSPDLPAYRHFFLGNRCSSQCDLVFNTSRNNAVDLSSLGWIAPSSRRPACAMRYNAIKSPVTLPASQEAARNWLQVYSHYICVIRRASKLGMRPSLPETGIKLETIKRYNLKNEMSCFFLTGRLQ